MKGKEIGFIRYLVSTRTNSIELTIEELAEQLGLKSDSEIETAIRCNKALKELELNCEPAIGKEEYDVPRIISIPKVDEYDFRRDLEGSENENVEFKASYLFNIDQAKYEPDKDPEDLASEPIEFEVLKTLCAFLNNTGGNLYIGVNDDGSYFGIENDFSCINKTATFDDWELKLRNQIKSRFCDGKRIEPYILIERIFVEENKSIVRVNVNQRKNESFVKNNKGDFEFRMRLGNNSPKFEIEELPDIILKRRNIE